MTTLSIPTERLFPDAETVMLGFIRGFDATWRIVTELPGSLESVLPVVQVTRIGGSTRYASLLDRPRIDIDVFTSSRATARTAALKIQSKMPRIRGMTASGAVVTDVVEEVGPSWRPDFNPNVRRFGLTYVLTLRPA